MIYILAETMTAGAAHKTDITERVNRDNPHGHPMRPVVRSTRDFCIITPNNFTTLRGRQFSYNHDRIFICRSLWHGIHDVMSFRKVDYLLTEVQTIIATMPAGRQLAMEPIC